MRPLVQLNRYGEELGGMRLFEADQQDATLDEKRQRLIRALRKMIRQELTPRQKEMVERYYFEKKKIREIAEEFGVNKSTVSRGLKAARARIERCLQYYFN